MRDIYRDTTSHSEFIVLRDSTTGLGKTGLAFGDITGSYVRQRSARVSITMASLAAATTAYTSGGWFEIDATNQPGLYRFDVPNNAFADGADQVVVSAKATGAITEHKEFRIVQINTQTAFVPNIAHSTANGLPTVGAGTGQIALSSGLVDILQTAADKVWSSTTRTLSAFSTALAVSVWDVLASAVATASSIGLQLKTNVDAAVTSRLAPTVAARTLDVSATGEAGLDFDNIKDATGAHTLTNITVPVVTTTVTATNLTANNDKTGYSIGTNGIVAGSYQTDAITSSALSTGAAQEIAGQVWDVLLSGHLTAGTTGNALNAAGSAGDPWSTALPGAYGAGTAGKIVGDNINATILSRSSHTAADVWAAATRTLTAQSDTSGTTTLLSRLTAGRATNLDFIDVAVSSRLATAGYTAPPSAATVASAILATALAELTAGVFPATPTVAQALMLPVHMLARGGTMNKTTGVSTYLNNAGATILKRTDSDDGTIFTEGALVAGP